MSSYNGNIPTEGYIKSKNLSSNSEELRKILESWDEYGIDVITDKDGKVLFLTTIDTRERIRTGEITLFYKTR